MHAEEFKELHVYYTTREQNPLKKMQSLIAIACKLLRIIFTILKKGIKYDPRKMLKDIGGNPGRKVWLHKEYKAKQYSRILLRFRNF